MKTATQKDFSYRIVHGLLFYLEVIVSRNMESVSSVFKSLILQDFMMPHLLLTPALHATIIL
jgi:hypothetical protein